MSETSLTRLTLCNICHLVDDVWNILRMFTLFETLSHQKSVTFHVSHRKSVTFHVLLVEQHVSGAM